MVLLSPTRTRWICLSLAAVLLLSASAFILTPASGTDLRPVSFDDTITTGGTGVDMQRANAEGFVIPHSEVFFSNYRYVVGYDGVQRTASEITDPSTKRQFGEPLALYVSDFSTVTPTLSKNGFVVPKGGKTTGWTAAKEAFFVVGSNARIPSGPIVLPFSNRADAKRFANAHGGHVVGWTAVQARIDNPLKSRLARFETEAKKHRAWANRTVASSRTVLHRPRSIVVGKDAPNVSAAVAAAPPNTTVYLPAGTYQTSKLVVDKPITVAGAGNKTRLRGDGNGSVVHVRANRVAVRNLRIDGVGTVGSRGTKRRNDSVDWDTNAKIAYGSGDAGIVLDGSNGSVVSNVAIRTKASGIIALESARSVFDNVTVQGATTSNAGFMGTILISGRSVIQNSTFRGGRDSIYTHRADGSVIRDDDMSANRYGVHEMYTSHTLIANNTARRTATGIIVMGEPTDNIVVGNDVRTSQSGITPAGKDSFYAHNVIANNQYGLEVSGDKNVFVDNIVVDNRVGTRAMDIRPASWVLRNDFVGNEKPVESAIGPLRTWTYRGVGNYWGPLPLADANGDGIYDRGYQPTGTVDSRLGKSGATSLARSPAAMTLRRARDAVSGLRQSGVLDTAPQTEPFHPQQLAAVRNSTRTVRNRTRSMPNSTRSEAAA